MLRNIVCLDSYVFVSFFQIRIIAKDNRFKVELFEYFMRTNTMKVVHEMKMP